MDNNLRKCDRCGVLYGVEPGIYGIHIKMFDLADHFCYDLNDTKEYYLCKECREGFISIMDKFLDKKEE